MEALNRLRKGTGMEIVALAMALLVALMVIDRLTRH
jgi:hypothetical protein